MPPVLAKLAESLSDVKALFKVKFGEDIDDDNEDEGEQEVQQDGITWPMTRGAAPSLPKLENNLSDVKALFKAKLGW